MITRAIVPAAGWGTRLRPLTNAIPKEMLPLGRKPVLEYILDELRACGMEHVLFVVSPGKEMIQGYFGDGSRFGIRCDYAIQPEMRGLGDAILQGESWSAGEPFVVAFGDCIIEPAAKPPLERVLETHAANSAEATVLCEQVSREMVSKYGILRPASPILDPDQPFRLAGVVEKPNRADAPSQLAVAARWVLSGGVFAALRDTPAAPNGEIHLTEAICGMIREGASAWAVPLRPGEARRDIGGWESYLTAAAHYAAADPEFGARIRAGTVTPNA